MDNPTTEEHLARREPSRELLELLAAALEAMANAVVIADRDAIIVWVNRAFEQLTGYTSQEAIGQSTRMLRSGEHSPAIYKELWDTIRAGHKWQGELTNRRKD